MFIAQQFDYVPPNNWKTLRTLSKMYRFILLSMALCVGLLLQSETVTAQSQLVTGATASSTQEAPEPDLASPEAINAMVARMSDDEVRELLLTQLNANASDGAANAAPATLGQQITRFATAFIMPIIDAVQKLPNLFVLEAQAIGNFVQLYGGLGGTFMLFVLIATMLGAGLVAEFAVRWWQLTHFRELDEPADNSSLLSVISYLFRRFLREMLGIVVFFLIGRSVAQLIMTDDQLTFAAIFARNLIFYPRIAAAILRFVLAPKRPELRLVNVSDRWAGYLYRNITGLVFVGGLTIFAVTFNSLADIDSSETQIGFWLDSAVYVYLILIAWTAREGLVDMLRGSHSDNTPFDEAVATFYPYYIMSLSGIMFVIVSILIGLDQVALLLNGAHYLTLFWLIVAPNFDTAIRGLVQHLVSPMRGKGFVAEAAYNSTKRSYIRIGRVLVLGLVVIIIGKTWNIQLTGGGAGFGAHVVSFFMTVIVGYVVFELVSLSINRRLAAEQTTREIAEDEVGDEGGGSGSRLGTVLPLLRVTAQAGIAVIFGLLAIGNLGIDITPLLAGAGILGLAIGFGAQKLVSDVVSGIFFLIDDAFRVGEYVEIGSTRGTVEKISIRSIQLRHHRGAVHTIPYGEIPQLTNYSRDWVIVKLKFTVPFDTNPNQIKKIFKKIGAEMMSHELYGNDFIEPFKSQGVFEFDDVGMVVRGKYMTKPGKQFTIRKEIYNRVKAEFDAVGIDFARREVRVAMPHIDEDNVSEAEAAVISAAAAEAVQRAKEQQQGT